MPACQPGPSEHAPGTPRCGVDVTGTPLGWPGAGQLGVEGDHSRRYRWRWRRAGRGGIESPRRRLRRLPISRSALFPQGASTRCALPARSRHPIESAPAPPVSLQGARLARSPCCRGAKPASPSVFRGSPQGVQGGPEPARGLIGDRLEGGLTGDGHRSLRVERFDDGLARLARTTTLHGSSRPREESMPSARCARDGLQAPRIR